MERLLLKYFVSFVLILSLNSTSNAQLPNQRSGMYPGQVFVRTSFVRGQDFLVFSENDKATYIMGVVDGFLGAMLFGADDKYIAWLHQYIGERPIRSWPLSLQNTLGKTPISGISRSNMQ